MLYEISDSISQDKTANIHLLIMLWTVFKKDVTGWKNGNRTEELFNHCVLNMIIKKIVV